MPNRLAGQTSPYLLQHAHNPVDWFAWGDEAFAEARRRDVPIFLSIGYSTCYWCHVMERESFENAELGRMLSDRFVCVKVDREERPDVDDLYMQATLMVRGQGGWPMTVFLEPERLRPFWCATYLPPAPRQGMAGLGQIAEGIAEAWREQRQAVMAQAESIATAVREHLSTAGETPVEIGVPQVTDVIEGLMRTFDRNHGGFGGAPKFPQPLFLDFLLDARRVVDESTRAGIDAALRHTLERMACGGLQDQVGGGFHRYSVDAHWTVPHFEKMLYDNALLASSYAHAGVVLEDAYTRATAERTLRWIVGDMGLPGGGFASALDAEVEGREGLNYLWTREELEAALSPEDAAFALAVYGVDRGANFQDPHHPTDAPRSVPRLADRPDRVAAEMGLAADAFEERLERVNARLMGVRSTRTPPRKDDKVLASWNGLAIAGLARGGVLLGRPEFVAAAERAAEFLERELMRDGRLRRSWRQGVAGGEGFLEDYAFVARGLMRLHEAAGGVRWLGLAQGLVRTARALFRDERGAWFDTQADQADLFVRPRSTHDGAIPSPSSVLLHVLLDLAMATGEQAWRKDAAELARGLSSAMAGNPTGAVEAVRGVLRMLSDPGLRDRPEITALNLAKAGRATPEGNGEFTAVEVYAGVERVSVSKATPGVFDVLVRIAPGYHVVAADPGEHAGTLVPFRAYVAGGSGMEAFADYPAGEEYGAEGQPPMRVYRGQFEMKVVLERQDVVDGRPMVRVRYQACSATECLRARTVELDVAIDVV